jgi:hypothetical protein
MGKIAKRVPQTKTQISTIAFGAATQAATALQNVCALYLGNRSINIPENVRGTMKGLRALSTFIGNEKRYNVALGIVTEGTSVKKGKAAGAEVGS